MNTYGSWLFCACMGMPCLVPAAVLWIMATAPLAPAKKSASAGNSSTDGASDAEMSTSAGTEAARA